MTVSHHQLVGHWCGVGRERWLLSRMWRDDPYEAGRSGQPITFWTDIYTLYDADGGEHVLRFEMSRGVNVEPETWPDPRWAAFRNDGVAALATFPMDPPLANLLLDNCGWVHLSLADRAALLDLLRDFVAPDDRRMMRIMHRAAYDQDGAEQLRLLLAFGVPADIDDPVLGTTALRCATNAGNEPAIQVLLEAGADPQRA